MFTIYDEDKEDFSKVEEPDVSASYTYADYMQWKYEERLELFREIFEVARYLQPQFSSRCQYQRLGMPAVGIDQLQEG